MTRRMAASGDRHTLQWMMVGSLAVAFVLLNAGFIAWKGVQLGGDSLRYINGAWAWLEGKPLGGYEWAYRGYMAVVALSHVTGAGLLGVVGLQIGVAAIAGLAVIALGVTLGGSLAGLVGAAFVLANADVVRWHGYILTDSLYTSAVGIVTFLVWRAAQLGGGWYGPALLVLLPTATLRPTGLVLPPVAAAFWGVRGIATRDWMGATLGALLALGTTFVVLSPRVQDSAGKVPGHTLRSGRVIYQHSAFRVHMPADVTVGGTGWRADLGYVARHPVATFVLGARRIVVELAHVRPYYRLTHNVLIVAVLLPLYTLAVVGIAATWRHPLTHLLLLVIAAHLLLVAVTLADYDGRFLLHIVGPLAALAAAGVGRLSKGWAARGNGTLEPSHSVARCRTLHRG